MSDNINKIDNKNNVSKNDLDKVSNELTENDHNIEANDTNSNIMELTDKLLADARTSIKNQDTLSVPIAELATLGAGVASLIPAFNTVTQTTTFAMDGLYKVANAVPGQVLKMAKDGTYWGSLRSAGNPAKMAKFAQVDNISATTKSVAEFDPTTMMMAVALYSIEKDLKKITEMQKEILKFLEIENESQIEADIETLSEIIVNYKYSWDNMLAVSSSHKLVVDIQNRARKNMIAYQKKVDNIVSAKKFIINQGQVNSALSKLVKDFKYYRLSLYGYSLASMLEIILSSNFKEDYIDSVKSEIEKLSLSYRDNFRKASLYLEKIGKSSVEKNIIKGIGVAEKAIGDLIGSIPKIRDGQVDEYLQDAGEEWKEGARELEKKTIKAFAEISNPGTGVFINKLSDIIQIFNHCNQICFDKENVYLLP